MSKLRKDLGLKVIGASHIVGHMRISCAPMLILKLDRLNLETGFPCQLATQYIYTKGTDEKIQKLRSRNLLQNF